MTKRVHPIRKILKALERGGAIPTTIGWRYSNYAYSNYDVEKVVALHVKPLLDALDVAHQVEIGLGEQDHPQVCDVCSLLAAWREKL